TVLIVVVYVVDSKLLALSATFTSPSGLIAIPILRVIVTGSAPNVFPSIFPAMAFIHKEGSSKMMDNKVLFSDFAPRRQIFDKKRLIKINETSFEYNLII